MYDSVPLYTTLYHSVLYDSVRPCNVLFRIFLYKTLYTPYNSVRLRTIMYNSVRQRVRLLTIPYNSVRQCTIPYHNPIQDCTNVLRHLYDSLLRTTLYVYFCLTLYHSEQLCTTLYYSVYFSTIQFYSV